MGEEILVADGTSKKVEVNEGNGIVATEMDEKTLSADKLASSNVPKDDMDECPAPKQIHCFYFIRIRSYESPQLKANIEKADNDLQRKNQARYQIIESLKANRSERSKMKSELQPFLAENKKYNEAREELGFLRFLSDIESHLSTNSSRSELSNLELLKKSNFSIPVMILVTTQVLISVASITILFWVSIAITTIAVRAWVGGGVRGGGGFGKGVEVVEGEELLLCGCGLAALEGELLALSYRYEDWLQIAGQIYLPHFEQEEGIHRGKGGILLQLLAFRGNFDRFS